MGRGHGFYGVLQEGILLKQIVKKLVKAGFNFFRDFIMAHSHLKNVFSADVLFGLPIICFMEI